MRQLGLIAACIISLCASAAAETMPTAKETLVVPPYPGGSWKKITDVNTAEQVYFEWIPEDQSVDDIKDILVEQVFPKLKGVPPGDFQKAIFGRISQACEALRVNGPVEHIENGYPIAYAQEYCSRQKGTGNDVDIFVKVISGKDALYVVQREFRRPADKSGTAGVVSFDGSKLDEVKAHLEARKVANDWLVSAQLCPPTSGTGECPSKKAEAEPAAPDLKSDPSAEDRDPFGFFAVNTATAEQVRDKLGKPEMENHDPDGRFVYIYKSPAGLYVTYLFDKAGTLTRIRAYSVNQ